MRKFVLAALVFVLVPLSVSAGVTPQLTRAQAATVMIETQDGFVGTGVVFKNGVKSFVWTAAHVVRECQRVQTVINAGSGQPFVKVTYDDVWVVKHEVEGGRKVGEQKWLARIVRYSIAHDVAVLQVYKDGAFPDGCAFAKDGDIPAQGEKLWHVGSMKGRIGMDSVSDGCFAAAGRLVNTQLYKNELAAPVVYDQVSMTFHHGSSGGGVFLQATGACIGLVTRYAGQDPLSFGDGLVVPARRLRAIAKETCSEYMLDAALPAPKEVAVVTMDDLKVPGDWPKAAPAPEPKRDLPIFPAKRP